MQEELLALLRGRRGHFRLESGYHSEQWFDLDTLFADFARLQSYVRELARRFARYRPEIVCGPATGGARLAEMAGIELGCGSCATVREETPGATGLFPVRYRVPAAQRAAVRGKNVVIVDDAISAGSAVKGSHADLLAWGVRPVAVGALVVFGEAAEHFAQEQNLGLESIARTTFALWPPSECPLCTAGRPLEAVSDVTPSAH